MAAVLEAKGVESRDPYMGAVLLHPHVLGDFEKSKNPRPQLLKAMLAVKRAVL